MRAVPLILASALALSGCKKKQPEDTTAPVESAGCALQAPCDLGGVIATVTAINDSRCPEGAQCMWAGDAVVTVTVGQQTLELHSNPEVGSSQAAISEDSTLVLEDVLPYPSVSGPPADADWRVKLSVSR